MTEEMQAYPPPAAATVSKAVQLTSKLFGSKAKDLARIVGLSKWKNWKMLVFTAYNRYSNGYNRRRRCGY